MKISKVYKFYAEWCGPCKVYAPTFEKVSSEMNDSGIEFSNVDIDTPDSMDLVVGFKVKGVPMTVKVYENGEHITRVGALNEFELKEFLNN
jgi:thiol-disulfide isomerase/thioredoxin